MWDVMNNSGWENESQQNAAQFLGWKVQDTKMREQTLQAETTRKSALKVKRTFTGAPNHSLLQEAQLSQRQAVDDECKIVKKLLVIEENSLGWMDGKVAARNMFRENYVFEHCKTFLWIFIEAFPAVFSTAAFLCLAFSVDSSYRIVQVMPH